MRVVCFDIDGTLIWTNGAGRRAIHRALLDIMGTAGPIETFRFDGRTDGEIITLLAQAAGLRPDAGLVASVLERYVLALEQELARSGHRTTVLPGVMEILGALEARKDCILGLVTGNVVPGARLKLRSAGIDPTRFRVGAFGTDSQVRRELPAIAQRRAGELLGHPVAGSDLVIIGDTPADVECGRGIGARAIGVGTAAYTPKQLIAAGADAAFSDLSDVTAVMEAILR